MSWISNVSYKHWRIVQFVLVVVLGVALILTPTGFGNIVSQIVLKSLYTPFSLAKGGVLDLVAVNSVNEQLRESLAQTSIMISLYEEASRENDRLRMALGFEPPPSYRLLPARVVSVTGGRLPISVTINIRSVDSLPVNLPVINQFGLIGRVEEVMGDYARVQLLTDPRNRVAARVASSREMGIVRYLPSSGMALDNFPNQGHVAVGDTVISSGLGGIYPPGLQVGTVQEVERPENRPFSKIRLQPTVNMRSIEELFILMPETL